MPEADCAANVKQQSRPMPSNNALERIGAHRGPVIIISGMPGSGKSTLGRSLGAALDVRFLDKDEILERLFEIRGVGDRAWRQELSRASDDELIRSVQASDGVVVSSHWRSPGASAASGTAVEWLAELNRPVVEIFCFCDPETAASRFKSRTRHPGHLDASRSSEQLLDQLRRLAEAGPLRVGKLIVVDTRTAPDVEDVAKRIRAMVFGIPFLSQQTEQSPRAA